LVLIEEAPKNYIQLEDAPTAVLTLIRAGQQSLRNVEPECATKWEKGTALRELGKSLHESRTRRFAKKQGTESVKKTPLKPQEIKHLKAHCRTVASRLGSFESLSHGSVMPQLPRAWRWTRKVSGKTVSLGLTPEKAEKMKHAIANHRALDNSIKELREITQKLILEAPETLPASNTKIVQKAR